MAKIHARAMLPDRPWAAAEFRSILATKGVFLVAAPNGFAIGRSTPDEGELLTLSIDPDHQRKGLGSALLSAFEAELTRRGATAAFLEVAADNHPAIALYRHTGWTQSGRRSGYYARKTGKPVDAFLFQKTFPVS